MAQQEFWLGSMGPFLYDDGDTYPDGEGHVGFYGLLKGGSGVSRFGDPVNGDYSEFEADGTLKFVGDATVWDDLQVPISTIRLGGANPADEVSYRSSLVIGFDPSADEYVYFNAQLPHSYKEGSDIELHVHIVLPTAGAGGGAENVKFDLTHSWASINGAFPTISNVTATRDVQNDAADTHILMEIAETISGTGKGISSILLCSLKRDTSVADNYSDEVYMVGLDFHFEKDTVGSRLEATK